MTRSSSLCAQYFARHLSQDREAWCSAPKYISDDASTESDLVVRTIDPDVYPPGAALLTGARVLRFARGLD